MKTKGLILTLSLGLAVASAAYFWAQNQFSGPEHYQAFKPTEKTFFIESEEEGESAKGYSRYMSLIRANPYTGQVGVADVKKAVDQAEHNPSYKRQSNHIQWTNKGPDNIGGRTRDIVVDNENPKRLFAGGVSGGLFRSTNGGTTWEPVKYEGSDKYKSLAIVCMEQASNGDIYFGTGEQGFAYSGAYKNGFGGKTGHIGMGIWKSTDRGKTWQHLESTIPNNPMTNSGGTWDNVHEIAISENNPQKIYAATDNGIRVSTDGGQNWSRINNMGSNGAYNGEPYLEVNTSPDGKTVYAATSSHLLRSTDNGKNFTLLNDDNQNQLPSGTYGRIETTISPSDPNFVYISIVNSGVNFITPDDLRGIYQTRDNGDNWTSIAEGDGFFDPYSRGGNDAQGVWDNAIGVDPSQKDRIFVGGINFWLWDGGGDNDGKGQWSQAASAFNFSGNKRYVHVDHHEVVFSMDAKPPKMYLANDGGIFRTRGDFTKDEKPKYKEINIGYNVTQFYALDASKRGDIVGGTQDNNSLKLLKNSLTGKSYQVVLGADGFYAEISDLNNDVYINESQQARVARSQDAGGSMDRLSFDDINGKESKSLFNTPFRLYENPDDSLSKDSVVFAADNNVVLEKGAEYEASAENAQYFRNDTSHFTQVGNNKFKADQDIAKLPGKTVKVLSNNGIEFEHTLKQGLSPLESIDIQDPVRALFTMPLENEIWLTDQMMNFSVNPSWFKLANVNLDVPMTLDYTNDGNTVFVGGWDGGISRVIRISGLRYAHFDKGAFKRDSLDVDVIGTFQNVVTGVDVDNKNDDRMLVTCGNYGSGDHVFYSQNAMDSASNVSFEVLDDEGPSSADLPLMPVYDGLFRMDSANQIFVGTEMGMWFLDLNNRSRGWVEINNGMPRVATHQLRQVKPFDWAKGPVIYAATHGRGIYLTRSTDQIPANDDWQANQKEDFEPALKVYPNPARNSTKVAFDIPKGERSLFQLVDLNGQIVREKNVKGTQGKQSFRLNVSELEKGNYILRMNGQSFEKTAKLSVAR